MNSKAPPLWLYPIMILLAIAAIGAAGYIPDRWSEMHYVPAH